jgi:hypothetical protein
MSRRGRGSNGREGSLPAREAGELLPVEAIDRTGLMIASNGASGSCT